MGPKVKTTYLNEAIVLPGAAKVSLFGRCLASAVCGCTAASEMFRVCILCELWLVLAYPSKLDLPSNSGLFQQLQQ